MAKNQLNELRKIIRTLINEEHTKNELHQIVSHVLSDGFIENAVDGSLKVNSDDEATTYEFSISIPKEDTTFQGMTPSEIEDEFEDQFGRRSYSGPGQPYTHTSYSAEESGDNIIVHVSFTSGLDV